MITIFEIAEGMHDIFKSSEKFLDENKRTGFASMSAFLDLNDTIINFPEDGTVDTMVKGATSELDVECLALWLKGFINLKRV